MAQIALTLGGDVCSFVAVSCNTEQYHVDDEDDKCDDEGKGSAQ